MDKPYHYELVTKDILGNEDICIPFMRIEDARKEFDKILTDQDGVYCSIWIVDGGGNYLEEMCNTNDFIRSSSGNKVYAVVYEIVDEDDYRFNSHDITIFAKYDDAKRLFDTIADSEYEYAEKVGYVIEKSKDCMCIYEDGFYLQHHSLLTIEEHCLQ